ncbi:UNVERIFIED_CONTAM: hypothetical protein RMT77_003292 [Armadillidium vulgare]
MKLMNNRILIIFIIINLFYFIKTKMLNRRPFTLSNCTCGLKFKSLNKIIGGRKTFKGEFPWHVALFKKNFYHCGGSIINNLFVLTAAHCFRDFLNSKDQLIVPIRSLSIVFGAYKLDYLSKYAAEEKSPDVRNLLYVVLHENFKMATFVNDIALIRLKEPITRYNSEILPVCLPPPLDSFENKTAIVSGWGAIRARGRPVRILRKTNITIFNNKLCSKGLRRFFKPNIMMCAASLGHDACQGDSGGPLMIDFNPIQYVQVGLVSFGIGCGNIKIPGGYTRLNKYLPWIMKHTSEATYCENIKPF